MLEKFDRSSLAYYEAIKRMNPDQLKSEWREIDLTQYWYFLETLPPIRQKANAFMVGECMTHAPAGAIYEAVTMVMDEETPRYFARPAYLQTFNPSRYAEEIHNQFNF